MNVTPSPRFVVKRSVQTGAELVSRTNRVNDCVALSGGTPLSVNRTLMTFVLGPSTSPGVQISCTMLVSAALVPGAEKTTLVEIKIFVMPAGP